MGLQRGINPDNHQTAYLHSVEFVVWLESLTPVYAKGDFSAAMRIPLWYGYEEGIGGTQFSFEVRRRLVLAPFVVRV
jgi:hypothetical protein